MHGMIWRIFPSHSPRSLGVGNQADFPPGNPVVATGQDDPARMTWGRRRSSEEGSMDEGGERV